MNGADFMDVMALTTRIALANSQITRAADDESIAELIADMQEANRELVELMAARRPLVIYALARRLATPAPFRHAINQETVAP